MTIKFSFNNMEIANPFFRFIFGVLAVSLALLIISVILFLLLPIVWLAILWMVIFLLSLPLIIASLMRRHGDIPLQKKLGRKNPNE